MSPVPALSQSIAHKVSWSTLTGPLRHALGRHRGDLSYPRQLPERSLPNSKPDDRCVLHVFATRQSPAQISAVQAFA
jgi:hypothetical protein